MPDFPTAYRKLKEKAKKYGISLSAAADREGVSRSTIRRWDEALVDPCNTFNRISKRVDKMIKERAPHDNRTISRKRQGNAVE